MPVEISERPLPSSDSDSAMSVSAVTRCSSARLTGSMAGSPCKAAPPYRIAGIEATTGVRNGRGSHAMQGCLIPCEASRHPRKIPP